MKSLVLVGSLALNALLAAVVLYPFFPADSFSPKMTCDQARSDTANKEATFAFARNNGGSFSKVHDYLVASDYRLRNVHAENGLATYVYTARFYPRTCGLHLPGLDGSIVRVTTNLGLPLVMAVD